MSCHDSDWVTAAGLHEDLVKLIDPLKKGRQFVTHEINKYVDTRIGRVCADPHENREMVGSEISSRSRMTPMTMMRRRRPKRRHRLMTRQLMIRRGGIFPFAKDMPTRLTAACARAALSRRIAMYERGEDDDDPPYPFPVSSGPHRGA